MRLSSQSLIDSTLLIRLRLKRHRTRGSHRAGYRDPTSPSGCAPGRGGRQRFRTGKRSPLLCIGSPVPTNLGYSVPQMVFSATASNPSYDTANLLPTPCIGRYPATLQSPSLPPRVPFCSRPPAKCPTSYTALLDHLLWAGFY